MRSERHRRGAVAESKVTSRLMELGFSVSIPFEEEKYDLIADYNGNLIRVQVKRVFENDGTYRVELRTQTANSQGTYKKKYDDSDFDSFCFYNPDYEEVYWVWVEEANVGEYGRKRTGWTEYLIENKLKLDNLDEERKKNTVDKSEFTGSVFEY